jgi:geranylgeranyl diphosphate synthase type II
MSQLLADRSNQYKEYIESYLLRRYFADEGEAHKPLYDSVRYSLMAGGKRLRPVFAFEFCRMCCGDWQKATEFAAAVEMIHTYSLIHDDLPCMDDDDYRRGRLTNHKVFGEGMAVLAGDALLTDAFAVAACADVSANDLIGAITQLSVSAGSLGMVGGQVLDIMSEQRECTAQEVIDIQSRKTGALIKAACVLGTIAGGGTLEQRTAAGLFAEHLGLAFQIRDDMLDVIGNAEELGKATNADAGKNTFVRLYGLEKCEELVEKYTQSAIGALDCFEDTEYIIALAKYLTNRKV